MKRSRAITVLVVVTALLTAPSLARADQLFTASVGYFVLRGEDARVDRDVLVENLTSLSYEVKDFNSVTFWGEWSTGIGDFIEAGAGVGYYRATVPSVYRSFIDIDGSEIEQSLRLRIIPVTAMVRLLPLGRQRAVQPYVGAGVGAFYWRYSETGDFVDFRDLSIFRDRFVASGTALGPVALGGVRVPIGAHYLTGMEIRYQRATGDLGNNGFVSDWVDLGGINAQFMFSTRF